MHHAATITELAAQQQDERDAARRQLD